MLKPVRRRIRRSHGEIAAILTAFDRSGQSAVAFAEAQRLALSTLRLWLARRRKQPRSPMSTALVPVTITPTSFASTPPIEVALANGRVLRFARGIGPEEIAAIVDALDRRCSR